MSWKQSKRKNPSFSTKGWLWLGFLLEIPLISKPGIPERASFPRLKTEKGEKEKGARIHAVGNVHTLMLSL